MRKLLPLLLIVLTSCVLESPFSGREKYFQAMGREGSIVVTVDEEKTDIPFVTDPILRSLTDRAERISLELVPAVEGQYPLELSGYSISGGAEGDYSYAYINSTLLHNAPGFEKRGKYYHSDQIEAGVAAPGLLLFSPSYEEFLRETYSERSIRIPDEIASQMEAAEMAIYSLSPKTLPPLGIEIPLSVVEKIDVLLLLVNGDELTGYLDMDTEDSARTLVTLFRNELIKAARAKGERPDIKAMAGYFVQEGDKVMIDYALSGLFGGN